MWKWLQSTLDWLNNTSKKYFSNLMTDSNESNLLSKIILKSVVENFGWWPQIFFTYSFSHENFSTWNFLSISNEKDHFDYPLYLKILNRNPTWKRKSIKYWPINVWNFPHLISLSQMALASLWLHIIPENTIQTWNSILKGVFCWLCIVSLLPEF